MRVCRYIEPECHIAHFSNQIKDLGRQGVWNDVRGRFNCPQSPRSLIIFFFSFFIFAWAAQRFTR